MQVHCPQCESRYQLDDARIKPSGVKVRCPKCQHTFRVFSKVEEIVESEDERTEYVQRPGTKPKVPEMREMTATERAKPEKVASPFKREVVETSLAEESLERTEYAPPPLEAQRRELAEGLLNDELLKSDDDLDQLATADKDAEITAHEEPTAAPVRKLSFSKKQWAIGSIVVVSAGIVAFLYLMPTSKTERSEQDETPSAENIEPTVREQNKVEPAVPEAPKPVAPTTIELPNSWIKGDPLYFQDYLNQMAGLPKSEKEKPEVQALIADALIQNGLLTGNDDQISSGLRMTSKLLLSNATQDYAKLGLLSYALWREDFEFIEETLASQVFQATPPFVLAELIIEANQSETKIRWTAWQSLLQSYPDFALGHAWLAWLLQGQPLDLAQRKEDWVIRSLKKFSNHRDVLKSTYNQVPRLYAMIEKNTARAAQANPVKPPSNASAPAASTPRAPEPKKAKPTPAKRPTRLPQASPDLVAANRQVSSDKATAQRLLEEGNQLYRKSKFDDALQTYQRALQFDPDLAELYKRIGMIFMARTEKERALRNFKLYLKLKPNTSDKQLVEGWINSLQ